MQLSPIVRAAIPAILFDPDRLGFGFLGAVCVCVVVLTGLCCFLINIKTLCSVAQMTCVGLAALS